MALYSYENGVTAGGTVAAAAVRSERKDGCRCRARRAVDLGQSDARTAGNLTIACLPAQLADELVHLSKTRCSDGLAVGDQPTIGVDRQLPADLGGPVGQQLLLVAVGAQS